MGLWFQGVRVHQHPTVKFGSKQVTQLEQLRAHIKPQETESEPKMVQVFKLSNPTSSYILPLTVSILPKPPQAAPTWHQVFKCQRLPGTFVCHSDPWSEKCHLIVCQGTKKKERLSRLCLPARGNGGLL